MPQLSTTNKTFPGWAVVAGSGAGIAFGSAVFVSSSFALLAAAIGAQFGWSQTQLTKAASIVLLLQMIMYPALGWILDRWGSRRVASFSIVLFAASLLVLSRISNSLTEFYIAFLLIGLLGTGTNVVSYARALTLWFDRKRGLALGVASGCQAVGAFVLPILMQKIIAASGWPVALMTLAGFEVLVCLPLVLLLVKDNPKDYGWNADGAAQERSVETNRPVASGNSESLLRSITFWKLALAFAIMGMCFYAWITNIAFILTKTAGLSLAQVAGIQAVSGVAFLFGRIGFGYLLDKFNAPRLAVLTLVLAALFYVIMGTTASYALVFVAIILGGVSAGGENDLMPYLASRYFGEGAVSKVFGWFLCAYVVGAAIGPVAFAQTSVLFHGPTVPLYVMAALQIIPAILFLALGPYRFKAATHA